MPRTREERLPWPPLARFLGTATLTDAAAAIGIAPRNVNHYVADGVPLTRADRIAVHLGVHPSAIWPDWFARSQVSA